MGICEHTSLFSNTYPESHYAGNNGIAYGQLALYSVPPGYSTANNGPAPTFPGLEAGRMMTNGWNLRGKLVQEQRATPLSGTNLPCWISWTRNGKCLVCRK
jgi:hypothetical protein